MSNKPTDVTECLPVCIAPFQEPRSGVKQAEETRHVPGIVSQWHMATKLTFHANLNI